MRYSIGLQSGATYGALGWGVLDRLLEDGDVDIEAISGSSSGAVNTIVLGYGLATGGREAARALLEKFWLMTSRRAGLQYAGYNPAGAFFSHGSLGWLPQFWGNIALVQSTSPYLWNPMGFHLVREVLAEVVDFAVLRTECPIRLYISAVDVLNGEARMFRNEDLTLEAAAASTNLPLYLPAREIDGTYYWDGGFAGAPKLQPLVEECESEDIILIRINPLRREQLPRSAFSVIERMIELAVGTGIDAELKQIGQISRLIEEGRLKPGDGLRKVAVHCLEGTDVTRHLPYSGKYNLDWQFLCELRDHGRRLADQWLAEAPHVRGRATSTRTGPRLVEMAD